MAAFGSLCQSWLILSGWNPSSHIVGFLSPFKREGALDRTKCRLISTISSVFPYNMSHRLAKSGYHSTQLINYY